MGQRFKKLTAQANRRCLRMEPLEDRRMLAVLTVQNNLDGTLANLAGDSQLSLREAIEIANHPGTVIDGFVTNDVADEIQFDFGHDGPETILLTGGELLITSSLSIVGSGPELLTIDAGSGADGLFSTGDGTRVMTIDDGNINSLIDVSLSGLTATGGDVDSFRSVGGIGNSENLTIESAVITGNSARGFPGLGGGVGTFGGELTIRSCLIADNYANGGGGGVFASDAKLTISQSIISNNDSDSLGGGVYARQTMTIIEDSLISDNRARQIGGGIASRGMNGTTDIVNSTITGNSAMVGGAVSEYSGTTSLYRSTVVGNISSMQAAIFPNYDNYVTTIILDHSIVANSVDFAGNPFPDIKLAFQPEKSDFQIKYSLVQNPSDVHINAEGNIVGLDPLIGPLTKNGGPTMTHALLPGSPALDAGDPSIAFGPNQFDQRGEPFIRVATGVLSGVPTEPRIDIGSYEAQAPPSADFNQDLHVNGLDFLSWQRSSGQSGAAAAGGDSDYDGDADASDLAAWQLTYGDTILLPPLTAAIEAVANEPNADSVAIDAALSLSMFETTLEDKSDARPVSISAEVSRDTVLARGDFRPTKLRGPTAAKADTPTNHDGDEIAEALLAQVLASIFEEK